MQLSVHLCGAVFVAALLSFTVCQNNCRVQDGKPGEPGVTGRDGLPGIKGEKGGPGLQVELSKEELIALKGDKGEDGPIGDIGTKGLNGVLGPPGPVGPPGNPGSGGDSGTSSANKAAFTVTRKNNYPEYKTPVIFDEKVTNLNEDFNTRTGYFTCKVAGVYYFVFHSVSEGDLCLKIKSDTNVQLNLLFCDYNKRRTSVSQVLSGGAVIQLNAGNKVWLEPFKINGHSKETNKMSKTEISVFSGFLIFATE